MKLKSLKKCLVESLTEQQRLSLITLLSIVYKPFRLVSTSSEYLKSCDTATFFGFLHKLMFGDWERNVNKSISRVMENISQLKEILIGVPITIIFHGQDSNGNKSYPQMPNGLKICNIILKDVKVTVHAWERFCERFCPTVLIPNKVADLLQTSFDRSQATKLRRGYETIRLMNNSYQAQYFYDKKIYCRFVVSGTSNSYILKTVEIPY